MMFPYLLRLLCLCFASFFLVNAALSLLVRLLSNRILRFAESNRSAAAARIALASRLLPFALASAFVAFLCIPSYLRLELNPAAERVSSVCALAGFLGCAVWCISLLRGFRAILSSARHNRLCASAGESISLPGAPSPVLVLESQAPLLAMSGLLRPQFLVSRNILAALSPEEFEAAMRHEHAHRLSRDNMKRFLFLLAPDAFPFFRPLLALESNWSRFTEWAADDQAAAGDSHRALSLAAALVRVAQIGSAPRLPVLSTSLLSCDRDLSQRVHRLLRVPATLPAGSASNARSPYFYFGFLPGFVVVVLLLSSSALSAVHEMLEFLVR